MTHAERNTNSESNPLRTRSYSAMSVELYASVKSSKKAEVNWVPSKFIGEICKVLVIIKE